MNKIPLIEQIRRDNNLLSLPQVLSEVLKEAGKEDFSADKLAKIILKDPSLTSRILKLSNSSFYHRFSEITTVHQAIAVLGVTTVKCMTLSSSIFHPEKIAAESGVQAKDFFEYLLATAAASEKIAHVLGYKAPEEAFIAGLLHDLGIIYLIHHHPQQYRKIVDRKVRATTLTDAEKEVFGIDHTEVGAHLAETLGLPEYVITTIRNHHDYYAADAGSDLSQVVKLASLLSNDKFSGYELSLEERLESIGAVSKSLSLSKSKVDEISFSLLPQTIEVAQYLGIDIGDVEEMLVEANQEIWKTYLVIENLFKERQELSRNLLEQERARGAIESKNVAMATLSHYLNNAAMVIYGRSQLMRVQIKRGNSQKLIQLLPGYLDVLDTATKKIVAVLDEMKQISPIDQKDFYSVSKDLTIDDLI
ncbi:MAG: HDOD domain-containing protein, partial [candidate division Zixibacteria bacterium]|nr:HDOD domain-containing protein [candidate division Zixibacteria bacterium]